MGSLTDKTILLGVTGGIAAYKAAPLCRLFQKAGAAVRVVMSEAACRFITPLTMETLSGNPVPVDMFARVTDPMAHITLTDGVDLFAVAPATADYLARCAAGRAEDLISATMLAWDGPVLAAPAMNAAMWRNPATQRNLATLRDAHGWHFVHPEEGFLACGVTGPGRMAEPETIVRAAQDLLRGDLDGRSVVVTAGPTVEDIDPVRFLSNRSSGKMGYAIAAAAAARGARTVLISGPTHLDAPPGVTRVSVRTAAQMHEAVLAHFDADAVIMAAAVADWRPAQASPSKTKRGDRATWTLELVQNPDILADLAQRRGPSRRPVLVGFALESDDLMANARDKLARKGADWIVANDTGALEGDTSTIHLCTRDAVRTVGPAAKRELAHHILDAVFA